MQKLLLTIPLAFIFFSFSPLLFQINEPLEESIKRGSALYQNHCITCHRENGEGISGAFPPLAKSDYLMEDKERSIKTVLFGMAGEIVVNGETFFGQMEPPKLSDQEIVDVLNFVRNSWGNIGEEITIDEIISAKK